MDHIPYPYMDLVRKVYLDGEEGPSRMGPLRYLTNQVLQIENVNSICRFPYIRARNENYEFIKRYIEATINALPESYMLELAPKNSKELDQLDMSYGEILEVGYRGNAFKVRKPYSKRDVRLLYNPDTANHNIPPCTMGFQLFNDGKYLDMNVFSRSIDIMYGLTNDIAVFFAIQMYIASMNGLVPRKFMISFGNLHFYRKNMDRIVKWIDAVDNSVGEYTRVSQSIGCMCSSISLFLLKMMPEDKSLLNKTVSRI